MVFQTFYDNFSLVCKILIGSINKDLIRWKERLKCFFFTKLDQNI